MVRRGVVPLEVAAVLAAAIVAAWDPPPLGAVPVILPLLVAASAFRWSCGKSFASVTRARFVGIGALGGGLGQMYIAAGRNVAVPVAARIACGLGALVLEMLRLVG